MSGFVEFSLYSLLKTLGEVPASKVVCFADMALIEEAIEIKTPDKLPDEWHPGYGWLDLNIMRECIVKRVNGRLSHARVDKTRLFHFVRAFGFSKTDRMFLHVWKSRMPKLAKGGCNAL